MGGLCRVGECVKVLSYSLGCMIGDLCDWPKRIKEDEKSLVGDWSRQRWPKLMRKIHLRKLGVLGVVVINLGI